MWIDDDDGELDDERLGGGRSAGETLARLVCRLFDVVMNSTSMMMSRMMSMRMRRRMRMLSI